MAEFVRVNKGYWVNTDKIVSFQRDPGGAAFVNLDPEGDSYLRVAEEDVDSVAAQLGVRLHEHLRSEEKKDD